MNTKLGRKTLKRRSGQSLGGKSPWSRRIHNPTYVTATGELEHDTPVQPLEHGSPLAQFDNADGDPAAFRKSVSAVICADGVVAAAPANTHHSNKHIGLRRGAAS